MLEVAQYIAHGFKLCAIPSGTKGPTSPGWNKVENALTVPPPEGGVGLLHAYSGTCAIDVDDLDAATTWLREKGISLAELLIAPDSVQVVSGKQGRAKLLYALPIPLPSTQVRVDGKVILEFRCASRAGLSVQDVLPPSIHPETGTRYSWQGNWREVPPLPQPLLSLWLIELEHGKTRNIPLDAKLTPTSKDEIRLAVAAVNPDCDRKTWVEIGMALSTLGDEFYDIWKEWSELSTDKYPGDRELLAQWRSFKPVDGGITIATVFHYAVKAGFRRPVPDVSELFKPIPVEKAGEVTIDKVIGIKGATADRPVCNLSLWPEILTKRAREVASEVGCDPVVPLVAGLTAVSAAVDKRSYLSLSSTWKVPPNIWCMTLGDPADKKTPGSKPMFAPLFALQNDDRQRYAAAMLAWKGIEARHASDLKAYREWSTGADAALPNSVPPAVTPLPPQPQPLRIVISDATSQKVVSMAEARPGGLLMYLDEMARFLQKLGDPRNTDDRGTWIQGYETGPYTTDRVGAGTTTAENLALSFYGNCQPAVFSANIDAASQDGIIQRFLYVPLDPENNKMWSERVPDWMSTANEYEQLIRRSYATPAMEYTLSPEGMVMFREFCQHALDLRKSETIMAASPTYITALGKMEGGLARLILLFHLIEDPYSLVVSEDVAYRAIKVFREYFFPALRYTYLMVANQKDPMVREILTLLVKLSSSKSTVTIGDLRKGITAPTKRSQWDHDRMIWAWMDNFTEEGYVSMLVDNPRFPVWTINPAVADLFKKDRIIISRTNQEVIERIQTDMTAAGKPPSRPMRKAMGFEAS
jgi:hypothetical protein